MDYKQKIEEKRQKLVDTLIGFIESNPTQWEAGWYSVPSVPPINGKTQRYNGINALYLCVLSAMRGYTDPRWVTFNQAKELGANVKSGEKSSEIFYWSKYDKKTKQSFDDKTCDGMTFEEVRKYMDENVRPVMKFYQVFNAGQCDNMPEYSRVATPEMEAEERRRQNALVEQIISNSGAPVSYDGGNRAYYSPSSDSIHLPEIKDFKSMQDYYATALHEIAHSTGHDSRLNRNLSGLFGTPDYAKEELRAALASVFMQVEYGISIEGKHFENHGAYLASWLKSVKNDQKEFFSASADAEKITSYIADNYLQEHERQEHKENKQGTEQLIENLIFSEQDTEPKVVVRDNDGAKVLNKTLQQAEQAQPAEQARQVGQAKWSSIPLDAALIGAERGKSTQLKMPDGEYSSFVFFAPTKFIRQDEKSGAVQLSVNDSFKYTLMKGNQRVELTGSELRQAMAGQVIGQRAQRVLSAENAQTLSDIYRNVPQEMRQYPNWCVFTTRWNEEKGKRTSKSFRPF